MKFLAYLSTPSANIDIDKELFEIFQTALEFNSERKITGVLFYTGNHFLQVIEGPNQAVDHLMQKIEQDKRHKDIKRLFTQQEHRPTIENWNMQPINLTDANLFAHETLEKAIDVVHRTMRLDAKDFVYLIKELLNEPDFQAILDKAGA